MLDSGAAIAEPDDARIPLWERRKMGAPYDPTAALPQLLETRHVRLELSRLRAPTGAAAGTPARRPAASHRTP
ncbi:MAG: hypothetical protein ACYDC2_09475 [Solirubrobacteraceae bacterium]